MSTPSDVDSRLRRGTVPETIDDARLVTPTFAIGPDAFLLKLPSGLRFVYRRGEGTVYAAPAEVSEAEVSLFFEGSVSGAIAWLNGQVPLHASAVCDGGGVIAFSGASGQGKSTLVAALARRGFPLFSDDVLSVDVNASPEPLARRGLARVKLWSEALSLTGNASHELVRPGIDKFYVPLPFSAETSLPLRALYLLDSAPGSRSGIIPVSGADRFNAVRSTYYRPHFCGAVVAPQDYFAGVMRLTRSLAVYRWNRPKDASAFEDGVSLIAAHIRDGHD